MGGRMARHYIDRGLANGLEPATIECETLAAREDDNGDSVRRVCGDPRIWWPQYMDVVSGTRHTEDRNSQARQQLDGQDQSLRGVCKRGQLCFDVASVGGAMRYGGDVVLADCISDGAACRPVTASYMGQPEPLMLCGTTAHSRTPLYASSKLLEVSCL